MSKQSRTFLVIFVTAAAVSSVLVNARHPYWAVVAGAVGILFHWLASPRTSGNDEEADSSYFFGFLLTLIFLATGLRRLGSVVTGDGSPDIIGFLEDLAAGLSLTIVGLLVRQLRTLGMGPLSLESKLDAVIDLWRKRPEDQLLAALEQSREAARSASADIHRQATEDGKRLHAAIDRLERAAASAIEEITKATSKLGDEFPTAIDRLTTETTNLVKALAAQRKFSEEGLAKTVESATALREKADESLHQHLTQWKLLLDTGHSTLDAANEGLRGQYSEGLKRFSAAGEAFKSLANTVAGQVESLPNPSERLRGLWKSVADLEGDLRPAVAGSVARFTELQRGTQQLAESLLKLGSAVQAAEQGVRTGSAAMTSELAKELRQMSQLIDEYLGLVRRSVGSNSGTR